MDRAYLGNFKTSLDDLSNFSFSGLYKLAEKNDNRWHLELGIDKSIGKNNNQDLMLTPMNTYMKMTMPYSMQMDESSTSESRTRYMIRCRSVLLQEGHFEKRLLRKPSLPIFLSRKGPR